MEYVRMRHDKKHEAIESSTVATRNHNELDRAHFGANLAQPITGSTIVRAQERSTQAKRWADRFSLSLPQTKKGEKERDQLTMRKRKLLRTYPT
jgi:hypothetical protein